MFGWRRRSEGFEWREYVRTTILVRRADRQRRLDDARLAAIAKVKDVAGAGADAGRASVSFAGSQLSRLLSFLGAVLLDLAIGAFDVLRRWLTFAFAVAFDTVRAIMAPLLEALHIPAHAVGQKLKAIPVLARRVPIRTQHVIWAATALALIYIGGPILRSADGVGEATITTAAIPARATLATELSGRATAIAGDMLRIDGTLVHLDGIEAPASRQPCYRQNGRRWNCAAAARTGLDRIIRGRPISCTTLGQDDAGRMLARCAVGGRDIATELVRSGYVFAASSLLNSLAGEEEAARSAKAGLWQGEAIRPQEWRDLTWEEAKRNAPDGCPIKGLIRASEKYYALPWSADYDRAKVRTERGERWFCSEDEAKAAGFIPSSRS
jgi:endonuclease YncB( thermonuclease family)